MSMNNIRLMVVDDHKMFLDGITSVLGEYEHVQIKNQAVDGNEALSLLEKDCEIDVLITDISMPGPDGEELCKEVKKRFPHINTLVLSMHGDSKTITSVLKNGAKGYVLKNTGKDELIEAIKTVAKGETYYSDKVKNNIMAGLSGRESNDKYDKVRLTKRELEILKLIASEYTTQEIADNLFISLHTVESHRKNIMRKADVRNMAGLIKYAFKKGLVE